MNRPIKATGDRAVAACGLELSSEAEQRSEPIVAYLPQILLNGFYVDELSQCAVEFRVLDEQSRFLDLVEREEGKFKNLGFSEGRTLVSFESEIAVRAMKLLVGAHLRCLIPSSIAELIRILDAFVDFEGFEPQDDGTCFSKRPKHNLETRSAKRRDFEMESWVVLFMQIIGGPPLLNLDDGEHSATVRLDAAMFPAEWGVLAPYVRGYRGLRPYELRAKVIGLLVNLIKSGKREGSAVETQLEPTIWFHGERQYSTDRKNPLRVSNEFDSVLQVFLDRPNEARNTREIENDSGCHAASRIIGRLAEWHDGVFEKMIRRPGAREHGGFFIRVCSLPKPG